MGKIKHTPGPWVIHEIDSGFAISHHKQPNPHFHIAEMMWSDDQSEADARLIASAPDLLAALKKINVGEGWAAHIARAAIAKAEGH
jgi:hypothetical protein